MDWRTHVISNQIPEHSNYNLLASDAALTEALKRTAAWSSEQLTAFGGRLGREETFALADAANRNPPILNAFDTRGHRIDSVEFHPAWHAILGMYREEGLVSLPFSRTAAGKVARLGGRLLYACANRIRHIVSGHDDASEHTAASKGAGALGSAQRKAL
jgi:putative acyl-CoA dehydrogenase